jgi:O-antigen biosynthesis protein
LIEKNRKAISAISSRTRYKVVFTNSVQDGDVSTKREMPGKDYDWRPDSPIIPGIYRITLDDGYRQKLGSERFFIENGLGNWETLYVHFSLDQTNKNCADIALCHGAKLLRFSPRCSLLECPTGMLQHVGHVARRFAQLKRILSAVYVNRSEIVPVARHAFRLIRKHGFRVFVQRALYPRGTYRDNYERWIATNEPASYPAQEPRDVKSYADNQKPLISILLPISTSSTNGLQDTINSVLGQVHDNWELLIVCAHSVEPSVRDALDGYSQRDIRIKVKYLAERPSAAGARNIAFSLASGAWCTVIAENDILHHSAIAEITSAISDSPTAEIIYSDEDQIDASGKRHDPYFKSDYSLLLLQTHNFLGQLALYRYSTIAEFGGWREFGGSEDYDLALRIAERLSPKCIRHIPKVLYHSRAEVFSANGESALAALTAHRDRLKLPAKISRAPETPCYRVRYVVPQPEPMVSLIIPTRDKVEILRTAVDSILEKTTYLNYEIIIVDNDSEEVETLEYFDYLIQRKNIHIHTYRGPFNYSALNNFAVAKCSGSIIGLINNDIEIISPDWLSEMVSWVTQPTVGCVGAKLYYGDGTIQHGGILLGVGGIAGHAHKHFPGQHPGYFYRLKIHQNMSAVTGACLLIRKSIYEEVGGLDETHLAVAFNDVDLCLKTRLAGYENVWTPYSELYHHESVSRGQDDSLEKKARFKQESRCMQEKWNFDRDPYYSPNLTRASEDLSLG